MQGEVIALYIYRLHITPEGVAASSYTLINANPIQSLIGWIN